MTTFRKYDHIERLGHRNVAEIEMGLVHVFPKLDGTNASLWIDDEGTFQTASRRRIITAGDDNAGFAAWFDAEGQQMFEEILFAHREWIIYGEWMVPHTLKTYREEIWRKFWVFDVYDRERGSYVPYEEYEPILRTGVRTDTDGVEHGIDIIEPLCTIQNPSHEQLAAQVETNTYLIAEGAGLGEGVVVKNYAWRRHGHPWAKVVRNVFKEEAARAFGHAEKSGKFQVELAIAEEFVTPELVGKTRAKVLLDVYNDLITAKTDGLESSPQHPDFQPYMEANYRSRVIPQLLGRVWHDLIDEDMWAILKRHKNASIDFKKLQGRVTLATKALAEDLF